MTEQRLGILGGMGRPTRLAPCGDPDDLICPGPMPLHNRRDGYV